MLPRLVFRKLILIPLLLAFSGSLLTIHAGMLLGPGKYSGIVIFDRWDTCLLLTANYVAYVSDDVKENLRQYTNQAIELNVSKLAIQEAQPHDPRILKYTILGPARELPREQVGGVRIIVKSDFDRDHKTAFVISIENSTNSPIEINSAAVGPTLMGLMGPFPESAATDGKSIAWITRTDLLTPTASSLKVGGVAVFAESYRIEPNSKLPKRFNLKPGASKHTRVIFKIPPGPYEFLVGFGGGVWAGKSLASNAISFHVGSHGTAFLDK